MTPAPNAATWRMVPVEPTPEMLEAGAQAALDDDGSNESVTRSAYAAMLAAAPAPATSEGWEVRVPGERGVAAHAARDGDDIYCWWETPDETIQPLIMGLDVATEFHAELSAALARAGGDGWRPIETAPKDGTRVLLWISTGIAMPFAWESGRWMGDDYPLNMAWPTHWRPMPSAPDAGEDGRG